MSEVQAAFNNFVKAYNRWINRGFQNIDARFCAGILARFPRKKLNECAKEWRISESDNELAAIKRFQKMTRAIKRWVNDKFEEDVAEAVRKNIKMQSFSIESEMGSKFVVELDGIDQAGRLFLVITCKGKVKKQASVELKTEVYNLTNKELVRRMMKS